MKKTNMSNISYELAKKLKDAGFPLKNNPYRDDPNPWVDRTTGETFFSPTLSELIDACGTNFNVLQAVYTEDSHRFGKTSEIYCWQASATGRAIDETPYKTPEEAVARLWLALQAVGLKEEGR